MSDLLSPPSYEWDTSRGTARLLMRYAYRDRMRVLHVATVWREPLGWYGALEGRVSDGPYPTREGAQTAVACALAIRALSEIHGLSPAAGMVESL